MAQDNTPAVVIYKGAQPKDGYDVSFDKGYYGEIKVAFVRYGLTDYDYDTEGKYEILGELYAWETENRNFVYTYDKNPTPNKTVVYKHANEPLTLDDGTKVTVVSTKGSSATFSNGVTAYYSPRNNIAGHTSLLWTGAPLGEDDYICIVRETQKDQPFVYPNNQKHIEGALDNLSRQIQELKANADASLKVDPSFEIDPRKMSPIAWLNTIVRSTDKTARGLRYVDNWLEYSTDDPNKAEAGKSWTKLLNTTNITTIREWYDEEKNIYVPQYSMDGGQTWKLLGAAQLIADVQKQLDDFKDTVYTKTQIDGKLSAVDSQIDANADAIQKTRDDYIEADSEIHHILNNHASELTTLRGNQASLGDQVSGIEEKIPESASGTNPLVTKADLGDSFVKKTGDTMTGDLVFDAVSSADIIFQDSSNDVNTGNINSVRKFISAPHQTQGFIFSEIKNGENKMQFSMVTDGLFMPYGNRLLGSSRYSWENVYAKKLNNGADLAIPTVGGTLARIEDLIDLRADINEADSELQTQITAQAAEIATKQDQLTAGDNIVIRDNVISATGAGGGTSLSWLVVQELPETGQSGVIYLVPKDGTAPDVYDEYVWITATQTFELIGSTKVDLSGYLPLSGGTLTGNLKLGENELKFGSYQITQLFNDLRIGYGSFASCLVFSYGLKGFYPDIEGLTLGVKTAKWPNIYAEKLNNGADLVVPTEGGTLARLEDLENIDTLPDQTGNAGKVLMTDGASASWQEAPAGGTKITIKRYS